MDDKSFDILKGELAKSIDLFHPYFKKTFIFETDASDTRVGQSYYKRTRRTKTFRSDGSQEN